jgi:hypothetical protein
MASAAQPNVGLVQGFADQEDGWGDAMNANLRALDALVQARVADKDLTTPPGSPAAGDTYIVAASPTGAWSGQAGKIARYQAPIAPDTLPVAGWEFFTPKAGWRVWVADEAKPYRYTGSAWIALTDLQCIAIACGDETTAITTGTAKVTFRMPFAMLLTEVRGSLTTAQTSGSIFTVDVNEGGASILSTKLTIDNTEKTSKTAATLPVISDPNLADDAEITIDVDQVGSATAAGLKVYLIGVPG